MTKTKTSVLGKKKKKIVPEETERMGSFILVYEAVSIGGKNPSLPILSQLIFFTAN